MSYEITDAERDINVIKVEIRGLQEDLKEVKEQQQKAKDNYDKAKENCFVFFVNKEQFIPIRNVVYGLVGTIMLSVLGALLSLVLRR